MAQRDLSSLSGEKSPLQKVIGGPLSSAFLVRRRVREVGGWKGGPGGEVWARGQVREWWWW